MRKILLCGLVALTLTLSGCATLDNVLLKRAKTPDGKELFVDNLTHERTTSPVDANGQPNEKAFESVPSDAVGSVATLFNFIPAPWNGVAWAGLSLLVSGYAAVRFKNRSAALKALVAAGMKVINQVRDDWKDGLLDLDRDGVVTLAEAAEYIKTKGLYMMTPEGIQQILDVITDALMPEDAKAKRLESLAAKLAKQ